MTSSLALRKQADDAPMDEARRLLHDIFGYHEFRGEQEAIIGHVTGGGDALVLMPTGGGKSLCYQIPALVRAGVGIVVSPLIALMQNQVDALAQLGVRAAFLNSSQDMATARAVEAALQQGQLDLLYVAPERLLTERFLSLLKAAPVALFAIDEAHCVSQWGHDFRPEYRQLTILHEKFPNIPRIALTATADMITRAEIVAQLKLQEARMFVAGFDRPNIRYRVVEKNGGLRQLLGFLKEEDRSGQAGIVYCGSRKKVEEAAEFLNNAGYKAMPYHAGMDQEKRRKNQQRFLRDDGIIMTATVAFGMGIDKPDVRFVAHLDLPQSLESYYQETGRAGRDGEPAEGWLAYSLGDVMHLFQRIDESEAGELQKRVLRQKLEAMIGYCETVQCRRTVLLDYFGEKTEPCGNCDTCLDPPETWDGTIPAQKVLSAALRTGQRFGAGYLMDVLMGKADERMTQNGHDKIPTFGVGKDLTEKAWRAIVRQLVAGGLLYSNAAQYGALQVTDKARPVLKGETKVLLRRLKDGSKRTRRERQTGPGAAHPPVDEGLMAALRELRSELAAAQNVPAYVIFHDSTLREIAGRRPHTADELREISGIGSRKLARYGEAVLNILHHHAPPPHEGGRMISTAAKTESPNSTIEASVAMFRKSRSVEEAAKARGLSPTTVYGHLASAIAEGELEVNEVVRLSDAEFSDIEKAFVEAEETAPGKLKPVFEKFNGKYTYDILRCIGAARGYKAAQ